MQAGDKVVCIYDFNGWPAIPGVVEEFPTKGKVYTVRQIDANDDPRFDSLELDELDCWFAATCFRPIATN